MFDCQSLGCCYVCYKEKRMPIRRTFNQPEDELRKLIDIPKYTYNDVVMQRINGTNECLYRDNLIYCANTGDTIAGASIQFKSIQVNDFIYHSFALVYSHKFHQNYILQIEIEPPDKISHREAGNVIYGAHCVTLNYTESLDDNAAWDWYNWLAEFEKRANLQTFGKKVKPFEGELF